MTKKPEYIISPVGLDAVIQELQQYLSSNLDEIEVVFGKAYKNENREGQFIPEVFVSNKEYFEVFSNDNLKSFIFFDVEQIRNAEYQGNTTKYKLNAIVRLIASANLLRIYPTLVHRANENLIKDIETAINSFASKNATWRLNTIKEGVSNVFSNYNYAIPDKQINMQPLYIVAFEFQVEYNNNTKC